MSLPGPDAFKDFIKNRFQKKSDEFALLDDDVERHPRRECRSGCEVPPSGSQAESSFTSKTPLQSSCGTSNRYGAAENKDSTCSLQESHEVSKAACEHDLHSDDSDSEVESEHCHRDSDSRERRDEENRRKAVKKLTIVMVLSLFFMFGELLGGYFSNSLAIFTDASHLLADVSSFLISIIALKMASRPSTKRLTYGWHRAEVMSAIVSVVSIWVLTGILVYLAVMRLKEDEYDLNGLAMIIAALCGLTFNLINICVLNHGHGHGHGHSHGHGHGHGHGHSHSHSHGHDHDDGHQNNVNNNVNVRAALVHVIGDLLQSVAVLIVSITLYFKPEWKIADPICTFIFSLIVLYTTFSILRDTMVVLMEGTPSNIKYEEVYDRLLVLEGVVAVHDLRIWCLTTQQCVMSCHLAIDKSFKSGSVLRQATKKLRSYNLHSLTIQIETFSDDMNGCKKCRSIGSEDAVDLQSN